ncbi:MAG TPA: T9SS type A sorting domain-containing protein [Candidatus Babeliaceae bacterium]|nr:T9SS type A sorting domain-containing protein [Candidatus Babeliaceae bacterium]
MIKKLRNVLFVLVTLLSYQSHAQWGTAVLFQYDANGDRIRRWVVIDALLKVRPKDSSLVDTVVVKKDYPFTKLGSDSSKIVVRAYPNPTTDQLTIENLTWKESGHVTVMLYTMSGDFISAKNLAGAKDNISLQGLSPGTYELIYYLNSQIITVWKIIKL